MKLLCYILIWNICFQLHETLYCQQNDVFIDIIITLYRNVLCTKINKCRKFGKKVVDFTMAVICMCVHSLVSINVTSGSKMFKDYFSCTINPALRTATQYGLLIVMDSLLCPWGKKAPTFFSKLNLRNMDTLLMPTFSMVPLVSVLISVHATKI